MLGDVDIETFPLIIEHLDIESICRICLRSDEEMLLIFDEKHSKKGIPIKQMIKDCTSCDVIRYDIYPHHICKNCLDNLLTAYSFQKQCQKAHFLVKEFLKDKENGLPSNNVKNYWLEKSTQTENQIFHPCEKCEARFWTTGELMDHHFYKHRNTPNVCKVCKQVFSRLGLLREHLSSKHPETGVQSRSECKICKKRFSQNSHLSRHLRNVHKITDVDVLTRKEPINREISTKGITGVKTRRDNKLRNYEIENSVAQIGENVLDATKRKSLEGCVEIKNEMFVEQELIIMDTEFKDENTNNGSESDEDLFPLSRLRKKILTDDKLINPNSFSKILGKNEEAELDHQKDSNEVELIKTLEKKDSGKKKHHRPKPEAKHKCKHCDRKFNYPGRLQQHEITHCIKSLKCPNCPRLFAAEQYLKIHQQNVHAEEKPHMCRKCQKSFSKKWRLRVHTKTCTVEKPKKYTCSYDNCPETFNFIDEYRVHIKKTHPSNEKIWICRFCAKKFSSKAEIQNHSTEHDSEKPHLCNECGKRFWKLNRLNLHIMRHTGEKKLKCKYCEKRFIRTSDLTVHQMYHTGEKPHKCETCGRGFIRACSLRIHVRTHTGEKPYQCSYCDRSFAQRQDMTAHIRRLHTGERYECLLCSEVFLHLYKLTHHKKLVHGINEPSHIQRVKKVPSKNNNALRK